MSAVRFSVWSSLRNPAFLSSTAKLQVAMPEFSGLRGRKNLNWNLLVALVPFGGKVGAQFQDCPCWRANLEPPWAVRRGRKLPLNLFFLSTVPQPGPFPDWQVPPFQLPSELRGTQDASAHFLQPACLREPPCISVSCPGAWQASFPAA